MGVSGVHTDIGSPWVEREAAVGKRPPMHSPPGFLLCCDPYGGIRIGPIRPRDSGKGSSRGAGRVTSRHACEKSAGNQHPIWRQCRAARTPPPNSQRPDAVKASERLREAWHGNSQGPGISFVFLERVANGTDSRSRTQESTSRQSMEPGDPRRLSTVRGPTDRMAMQSAPREITGPANRIPERGSKRTGIREDATPFGSARCERPPCGPGFDEGFLKERE